MSKSTSTSAVGGSCEGLIFPVIGQSMSKSTSTSSLSSIYIFIYVGFNDEPILSETFCKHTQRSGFDIPSHWPVDVQVDVHIFLVQYIHIYLFITVFKLQLKGHDFAAKKYIKFSDDTVDNDLLSDTEKIRKNKYLLYSDAGRLMQCAAFLRAFYDYAQRNDVQRIDWDIQFSKCFLLQEDGATPSIASAMKFAFGEDEGVTWLVEPRRSTSFEKFTGTLCHSRAYFGGLASETVHAFAHYVYIFTKHEVVVADLQGTLVSVDGKNLLMLFDPMTHTAPYKLSGSGDFGEEGIKSFVRDHECGPVCKAMKLDDEDESEVETPRDSGKAEEQGQGNRRHWATVL
ncbi:hypothetical protein D9757_009951 [Collybiopsis confluens]|uniref:Alpha-type protein kinase domain-containing protein n=1 Tax=Collybiopsis confluens TaxID=2823264 RepID=A0A8H5H304_9AGAR|nr:hypothetical protein D9757_009951 [Collybiopsis confluens]